MDLIERTEIRVRFGEVDSMRIVWHGHYLRYFEDAREAFGMKFGLGYLDVYKHNVMIPIVRIGCDYKKPLEYGDIAIAEAKFVNSEAAKILFHYKIYRKRDMDIVATGDSMQVFLTPEGELLLNSPDFFTGWKKHWGII